jgi:hypothetical protein
MSSSPLRFPRLLRALALLLPGVLLAACDSGPSGPVVQSVRVQAPAPEIVVGASMQLSATPLDASGQPVSGQSVIWSSSSDAVAQVDGAGRVSGVSVGSVTVRANVAGVTGSISVSVIPVPVASVEVSPATFELVRGEERFLEVTLRDAQGRVLEDRPISFQSADPNIATVSVAGRVLGVRAGQTLIVVSSGGVQAAVQVRILPADEPVISSLSVSSIREGLDFDIRGERFSPAPELNTVRIGGELTVVTEAEPTRLRVRAPSSLCLPLGGVSLTVEVGGDLSPPFVTTFEGGQALSMAPGEFRLFTEAGSDRCLRFASTSGNERYIIGIQSVAGNAATVTALQVQGLIPVGAVGSPAPAPMAPQGIAFSDLVASQLMATTSELQRRQRHEQAEEGLRIREAEAMQGMIFPADRFSPPGMAALATPPAPVAATVQVGDTVRLNIPDLTPGKSICQDAIPIQAVVRRVGSRSIWVEDIRNPLPGLMAGDYQGLGNQYDDRIIPPLASTFGAPTDRDRNGRIVIVISEQVNRFGGILGFVVSSDFFPRVGPANQSCPASNEGEYFYTVAPDPTGVIPVAAGQSAVRYSVERFREELPRLVAHETAHVIQFGRRYETPGATSFGSIWELEGQAVLAEEVVGWAETGLGPRQNLGFSVAFNEGNREPFDWFSQRFADLARFYGFRNQESRTADAPGACGWMGRREVSGACDYTRLPYGVSWSFLRWLSDHKGPQFTQGERELQQKLVEARVAGFPAFEEILGEPIAPLLAYWSASLYTDGRVPAGASPLLSFPSWDLRGIEARLFPTARLQPRAFGFTGFSLAQPLAAGSTVYLLLDGAGRPHHAIRARTANGGALPAHVQIWAVRLQ